MDEYPVWFIVIAGFIVLYTWFNYNIISPDEVLSITSDNDCFYIITKDNKQYDICGWSAQIRGF